MNGLDRARPPRDRDPAIVELAEQIAALVAPPSDRSYGVCVGGAMVREGDEYRSPLAALIRAEQLRALLDDEGSDEPVQVLLWTEPAGGLEGEGR